MILRLLTVRVLPGAAPQLVERLRGQVVPEVMASQGLLALNYGLRQQGRETHALALSIWRDYQDMVSSLSGDLEGIGTSVELDDLVTDVRTAHYEVSEPDSVEPLAADGAVIGLVISQLKPNVEPTAFDMIRDNRPALQEAGALARYVGRRVAGSRSEVIAVAVWPDRTTLRRYARQRPDGVIRPDFLDLLERWTFETYDTMSPQRLLLPSSSGPAVLLADDDGRYVDASPGVERVFGVPGEFMLGRLVWEFTPATSLAEGEQLWQQFIEQGSMVGSYTLMRPDGSEVITRFRAVANSPTEGVHASLLFLPEDEPDDRPMEDILSDAFGAYASDR